MRLIGCLLLCLLSHSVLSQFHPKSKALIDSVSVMLCQCVNDTFDDLDDDVKRLVYKTIENPIAGQQGIQDYLHQVDENRKIEVLNQLQTLGSIDSEMTACFISSTSWFNSLQSELLNLSNNDQWIVLNELGTEQKTIAHLLNGIHLVEGCNFAYEFISLGLELKNNVNH